MPITDIPSLRTHLQWALEVEHATIPPYLCALYSIPDGHNLEAAAIIRSVVMEEMLHMTLVANLLNAVGGTPRLAYPGFVPAYPAPLPHATTSHPVQLLPLSAEALEIFCWIEQPAPVGAPPEGHDFHTIAQFYEAVADGFKTLVETLGPAQVFTGSADRQVHPNTWYYGGGGNLVVVNDLASALSAMEEITEQGEGFSGSIMDNDSRFGDVDELAHYYRFRELQLGRRFRPTDTPASGPTGATLPVDWKVIAPMRPNPHSIDYTGYPSIHRMMERFSQTYTRLLQLLENAYGGKPSLLREAVPVMYEMRYQAQALMRVPSPLQPGTTVGPAFEFDASPQG